MAKVEGEGEVIWVWTKSRARWYFLFCCFGDVGKEVVV